MAAGTYYLVFHGRFPDVAELTPPEAGSGFVDRIQITACDRLDGVFNRTAD
jgi:hypothetical protein